MPAGQIDIIIAKKALAEIDSGTAKIEKMNTEILELSKNIRELNVNLSAMTTPKGIEDRLKKNAEAQLKIKGSVDKVIEAETKLRIIREKGFDKFEKDISKQQKLRESQVNKETALRDRLVKQQKKEEIQLEKARVAAIKYNSAYATLNRSYEKARINLANLLSAQTKNTRAIKIAQREFDRLGTKVRKVDAATRNYTKNIGNYSGAFKGAIGFTRQMVSALGVMGGAFLAVQIIRNVVKTIKDFNKESAVLASVLQKDIKEVTVLTKNAKELGAITAKTANEVVKLQVAYARLGFTQEEILELTEATIEGSIALNAELDATATLVGAIVNSFDDFEAVNAPEIIDVLSLATAKSALNFQKLESGLPIVAGAANAAGVSFTKLVSLLGKLADSGIDTSKSATALRNIFIISAAQGLNYSQIIQKIKDSQDKLTASNDEFGRRAAVSATVLAKNIDATEELDIALQKAGGTAKTMAETQLNTLSGEIILLTSAWSGLVLAIEDGEGAISGFFRGIIKEITIFLNVLKDLSELLAIDEVPFFEKLRLIGIASTEAGREEIKVILDTNKAVQDKIELTNKLVDLIDENAQKTGLGIDKEREYNKQIQRTTEDIQAYVDELKALKKSKEDANKTEKKTTEIIGISIESLQDLITENNKLIKTTDDNTYRRRLLQENLLLAEQIRLLTKVPEAVKAINAISVGVVTKEELKKREGAGKRKGTALAGGTGEGDPTDFIGGLTPTLFPEKGPSEFETLTNEITDFVDTYGEQIDQAIDITNAFFDNRIERLQQDIDFNNDRYEQLIAAAEGNEEQQTRLENERIKKEKELKKKQRIEQNKQAIINKAVAIAQTVINTAQAIIAALAPPPTGLGPIAGIPLAIGVGVLGAAQIAIIASTPIPKFAEGTESAPKGLGVVGDAGVHEYIETDKGVFQTPDTDTLVNFEGREKVHKNLDSFMMSKNYDLEAINNAAVMASIFNDGEKLSSIQLADVFSDSLDKFNSRIETKIERGIKRGFKSSKINNETIINLNSKYEEEL